jgi:hypothetical protein
MAWAGTGALCVMEGGILKSYSLSRVGEISAKKMAGELSFVQITDSHMGFNKPANPDVAGTLKSAVEKINGLSRAPEFMLHTGDISHLSKPEEFDTVDQIPKSASLEAQKSGIFVCVNSQASGKSGAKFQRVLLLKLKDGLLKGRETWKEFDACPVIGGGDQDSSSSNY